MAKRRPARLRAELHYPSHLFKPGDLLSFIELSPFSRHWDRLELTDKDLAMLQIAIMVDRSASPVIEGTGGLRKLRFVPPGWPGGKSGALRVCHAFLEEVGTVVLGIVYEKGAKDDLDDREKAILRQTIDRIKRSLLSRPYRYRVNPKP